MTVILSRRRIKEEFQTTDLAKSARICVEVDIIKVLISRFEFNNHIYNVEYEGLHLVCFGCGRYGHKKEVCSLFAEKKPGNESGGNVQGEVGKQVLSGRKTELRQKDDIFGLWMIAKKGNGRCRGSNFTKLDTTMVQAVATDRKLRVKKVRGHGLKFGEV